MRYKIQYSPLAIRDLDRVWSEVFEASKEAEVAMRYIDGLMACIANKSEFPKNGSPLYYEGSFTGYYFVTYKAYKAFYHIQNGSILVDHVVFGKSDYMRTIFRGLDQ